ncbi:putative TOS1-like glycosyl hydrolase-domain-containing protein [Amylocarpus encephaloides]|uniref:glucan endo-1,3-beta-D-glucosidase n=1 Tax=Amylocarpus encephaloides TaxID=45428 RepID=A0A9P8C1S0_9HELO|nr:putative TOS1-like glycosyl hydrolase-domain-containing protein [Amylocarpus encephaloides]
MHVHLVAAGLTAATLLTKVQADLCHLGSTNIDGNEYCQAVQAIRYSNIGTPGTYSEVTNMAPDGTCLSKPKHFSGPLAPLDEEISLHFRGPLHLKQFAAYVPSSAGKKKRLSSLHRRNQGHQHQHQHLHNAQKRKDTWHANEEREIISATIDGVVVSWEINYSGDGGSHATAPQIVTATIDGQVVSWTNNWFGTTATPTSSAASAVTRASQPSKAKPAAIATKAAVAQPANPTSVSISQNSIHDSLGAGVFERIGYYDSASQTVDNLVFLGNHGGDGSGVFDEHYGASLAYSNSKGTGGAASPQILSDVVIPSDSEVIIMLQQECKDNSCGYVRPGSVAQHGFAGADKMFLMEFSMPFDGKSGFNADMPAIWALNAKIPRTLQYGDASCSCWGSGCGEFDILETLSPGSKFLKSTVHTNEPCGDSDYVLRPTSDSIKVAVIFSSATSALHVEVLSDSANFSSHLTPTQIDNMVNSITEKAVSRFHL